MCQGRSSGLTLTVPSEEALMMWCPSGVNVASLTKEAWPRNSFSDLPDLRPWILRWTEDDYRGNLIAGWVDDLMEGSVSSHLMVWSKEALRSWLLSLQKVTHVTPLLWARSNRRRHCPLWIFHTCTHTVDDGRTAGDWSLTSNQLWPLWNLNCQVWWVYDREKQEIIWKLAVQDFFRLGVCLQTSNIQRKRIERGKKVNHCLFWRL